jgi:putative transposase
MHTSQSYPSDLNDAEWSIISRLIPEAKPGGRPAKYSRRMILDAIFYINRSGCQWRMLPKDFPPRSTVFGYFAAWRKSGLWEAMNARLREQVRKREGRKPSPTAAIIDSQSVKGAEQGGDDIGYDAGKKVSGRKRHIVVDTLGMILGLCVTSAAVQDRDGAATLLSNVYLLFHRLQVIWADGGYSGALVDWVKGLRPYGKLRLEIVKRSDDAKGFQLVRKRWIVERTFSWLYKCRRLARDYERRTDHSESQIYVSMSRLMLKRLVRS